jgi:hypothetical protein
VCFFQQSNGRERYAEKLGSGILVVETTQLKKTKKLSKSARVIIGKTW